MKKEAVNGSLPTIQYRSTYECVTETNTVSSNTTHRPPRATWVIVTMVQADFANGVR